MDKRAGEGSLGDGVISFEVSDECNSEFLPCAQVYFEVVEFNGCGVWGLNDSFA